MKTLLLKDDFARGAEIIRSGGLVAVPTETVYGLAANGLDTAAVERLYEAKGRPAVKPLSLMVLDAEALARYCEDAPKAAYALAKKFWPGPLTIVLKSKPHIPELVRAGGDTVGLRCPDHPLTLALLGKCGLPLAAPSANPSGAPSPKTAEEVLAYFDGKIDAVLDGGPCALGVESAVFDMSRTPYALLRPGALSEAEIDGALTGGLKLIGITGGTGSGKTTALEVLRDMGALVVDCDAVYHELTEKNAGMRAELTGRFGDVYDGDRLDRKKLGETVFCDPEALGCLNRITHKYVDEAVNARLAAWARMGGEFAAVDAIALLGSGLDARCAATVGVTAPTEARVRRVMDREGVSEKYARMRVAAQRPNEYFEENCSYTLANDGTREEFEEKCRRLFKRLLTGGN